MLQAIHDPERYGGQFLNGYAGLIVPAAIAQFARVPDPYQRDVRSFGDAVQARLPGMRQDLPVQTDILGTPKANPAFGVSGVVGVAARSAEQDPLQLEISDIGFKYSAPPKKIGNVELDATAYESYAKLSGELVRSQLENLVDTPLYQNTSKTGKNILMKRVAERARQVATRRTLVEQMQTNPDFYTEYRRQQLLKRGVESED
jgi:hypothetical protein